jgi:hypothetical protein
MFSLLFFSLHTHAQLSYHPREKVSKELANDVWQSWNPSGSFGWKQVGSYGKGSYQQSIYINNEKTTKTYLGGKIITTLALLQGDSKDKFAVVALVADCEIRVFSRLGGFQSGLRVDKSAYYSADEFDDYYFNIGKMVNTNLNELELFVAREAIINNPFSLLSTGTMKNETGDVIKALCGPRKEIQSFAKSTLNPPDISKINEWYHIKYEPDKNPSGDDKVAYHKDMTRTKDANGRILTTGWRQIVKNAYGDQKQLFPSGNYTVMAKVSIDCSHHNFQSYMESVVLYRGTKIASEPVINEAKLGPLFTGRSKEYDALKSKLYSGPIKTEESRDQCRIYDSIAGNKK